MTLSIRSQPRLAAHARPTRALRLQRSAGVLLGARPIGVPPSTSRATKPALTTARVSEPETRKGSVKEMSSQMKDMRAQMEENEDLSVLMRGLRGTNIDESDFAASDVKMQLVDVGKYASQDGDATDSLPQEYDPEIIAAYWGRRPGAITTRIFQLMGIAGGFLGGLALDAARGKVRENEVKRAIQLRNIITSLGPAYIKLGQALAIRPDILSPAAMNELQKLCDKVPSFDSTLAMQFIEEELGAPWTEFYSELTPEPVAAASLGQVYKGRLKTGEQVAVKVQRPYVLETVTIDLYILRRIGFALRKVDGVNTDIVGLLDEWAERFFEELDYVREGNNATKFAEQMKDDLPQIVVPMTYPEFTSRRVL